MQDTNTYLLPHAKNLTTGQNVKTQDLTGARFTLAQRKLAQSACEQLAEKMTNRTGDPWTGYLVEYVPTYRRNQS
jgi:hypothetical protein